MRNRRNTRTFLLGCVLAACSPFVTANATTLDNDASRPLQQSANGGEHRLAPSYFRQTSYAGSAARTALRPAAGGFSCVPYARRVSGIGLIGNAWQWWGNAEGRYARGRVPETGSVLAFRSNGRMHLGHVAVVTRIINSREIVIDHANWANRGAISRAVPVVDISPANNWTAVRVGLGTSSDFGSVYPTYGFIYDRPDNGVLMVQDVAPPPAPALNPIPSDLRPVAERPWQMYEEVAEAPARPGTPQLRAQPLLNERK